MALILYLLFIAIAIAGRIALHYKITGDHGVRPVKKESTLVTKTSSVMLLICFLGSFILCVLSAAGHLIPLFSEGKIANFAGVAIGIIGILLTSISQYQMGKSWRIGVYESEETELITHGVYAYIRNPIYSGVILFGIGLLLLVPHTLMFISMGFGYISIELAVRYVEEPYLRKLHGDQFELYAMKTNRYFPSVMLLARGEL